MAGFITPPPGLLPEVGEPADRDRPADERAEQVVAPRFFMTGTPGLPAPAAADIPAAPAPVAEAPQESPPQAAAVAAAPLGRWTITGPGGERIDLPEVLYAGRDPKLPDGADGAVLALRDQGTVSKTHAVLRVVDGRLTVEDLGSTNGTAVIIGGDRTVLVPRTPFAVTDAAELRLADARLVLQRS